MIRETILTNNRKSRLCAHNTFTPIDLTITTPNLSSYTTWNVENDLYGIDHFPIIISLFQSATHKKHKERPKFILNRVQVASIGKIIISSANKTIPKLKQKKERSMDRFQKLPNEEPFTNL